MLTTEEMNAVTRKTLLKVEPTDVVHYKDPLVNLLMSHKLPGVNYQGGPAFQFRFLYGKQPLKAYDGNTYPARERKPKYKMAEMGFYFLTADAEITHNDWLLCNGKDEFEINMMRDEIESARQSFVSDIGSLLLVAQSGLNPNSIYDAMKASTYGGIARSGVRETMNADTASYLMPYTVTSASMADNIKALNKMWFYQTTQFSGELPDVLLVNDDTYDLMFDTMYKKTGYIMPLTNQRSIDLGFGTDLLSYNSRPIMRNPNIPTNEVWSLPFAYIGWMWHPQEPWQMEEEGWHKLNSESADKGARFIGTGNTVCVNPGALAYTTLSKL